MKMVLQVDLLAPLHSLATERRSLAAIASLLDLDVVGIELTYLPRLLGNVGDLTPRDLVVTPRVLIEVDSPRDLPTKRCTDSALPLYIPRSLASARYLAKAKGVCSVALTVETLRFVDEMQVNFMSSSRHRKFVEVLLGDLLELVPGREGSANAKRISLERALHFLSRTIDRALANDVGIIVSSGRRFFLHPIQLRALLKLIGYTHRERVLMTVVYPLELLRLWLRGERFVRR